MKGYKTMIKILFVCHGNICRSPMAEFILKDMVKKRCLEDEFIISSCATSTEEIYGDVGNPVYPPAKEQLRLHGISCEGKRAVQLKKSDYDKYDLLIGMDRMNLRNMQRITGGDPQCKMRLMKDYTTGGDVFDPWYSGDFETAFDEIYKACQALLDSIIK